MTYSCIFLEKRSPNMAYSRVFITCGYSSQRFIFTTHKLQTLFWLHFYIKTQPQVPLVLLLPRFIGNNFFFNFFSSIHIPAQHVTCNSCLFKTKQVPNQLEPTKQIANAQQFPTNIISNQLTAFVHWQKININADNSLPK